MIYEKMTSDEWKDILKKYTESQQEDQASECNAAFWKRHQDEAFPGRIDRHAV